LDWCTAACCSTGEHEYMSPQQRAGPQVTKKQSKASSKKGDQSKKRKRDQADDAAAISELSERKDKDAKLKKKKRKQLEGVSVPGEPQQVAPVTADNVESDRQEKTEKKKKKQKKSKSITEAVEDVEEVAAKERKSKSKADKPKLAVGNGLSGDDPAVVSTIGAHEILESAPSAPITPASVGQAPTVNGSGTIPPAFCIAQACMAQSKRTWNTHGNKTLRKQCCPAVP